MRFFDLLFEYDPFAIELITQSTTLFLNRRTELILESGYLIANLSNLMVTHGGPFWRVRYIPMLAGVEYIHLIKGLKCNLLFDFV